MRLPQVETYAVLALGGAYLAYKYLLASDAPPVTTKAENVVATVDGKPLAASPALAAAVAAYPSVVAGVRVTKSRLALGDLWPQIRKVHFTQRGWAGAGTRRNQPALDYDDASEVVSAALRAARVGIRHRSLAMLADFGFGGSFLDDSEQYDDAQLTDVGRRYKQAAAALLILTRANFGADISALMVQNCTDAAQRLCDACDDTSYQIPVTSPSIIDSLGVGVAALPDTLGGVFNGLTDGVTSLLGDAAGAVLFSTPVLAGVVALAWWRLA